MPRNADLTSTAVVFGLATYALVFYLGYQWGLEDAEGGFSKGQFAVVAAGERLREELQEAERAVVSRRDESSRMGQDVGAAMAVNSALAEENKQLSSDEEEWVDVNNACIEKTVRLRKEWRAADEEHGMMLEILTKQEDELAARTAHLRNTDGLKAIILANTVAKLGSEHSDLRAQLHMPSEPMSAAALDALVDEWTSRAPEHMRVDGVVPLQESEVVRHIASSHLATYDKDRDAKHVFFPRKDSNGQYVVPTWNKREGTQPLRHGTFFNSPYEPVVDIRKQFRTLYDYATCAVGLNITQLMYPSAFKACPTCPVEHLHDYIETPLVLFCDQCLPQHFTDEFKLLCNGYLDNQVYGSGLFWRARSRLRFKAQFMKRAEEWLNSTGAAPATTLAARMPFHNAACGTHGRPPIKEPTLAFRHVLKKMPQVFDTPVAQCQPDVDGYINGLVGILKQQKHIRHLYISTDASKEDFDRIASEVKKQRPVHIIRRSQTGRMTEDTIIDVFIAALASYVVVNRYETHSALVAEAFLLQNALAKKNVEVW